MHRFLLTIILSLTLFSLQAQGQDQSNEGTEFWFGFMEHIDVNDNSMIVMITSKRNTSGTVRIPGIDWSETFSVVANQVTIINLPAAAETIQNESISKKGVQLIANDLVSVYIHQFQSFRSEATIVLPTNILGNAYYTVAYNAVSRGADNHPSEFLVVATEDETNITIQLSDVTESGKTAGSIINVQLNEGDTYLVQSRDDRGDLTGSYVEGDKPFSLFSGNSWAEVPVGCGARDNLLEQMIPISTWGRQFLTVPSAQVNFDAFRIVASEDDTNIVVQGISDQEYNLNSGQFVEYTQSEATFIKSDKPIMVVQYLIGSRCSGHLYGDPSMVVLNTVEQTRDTVTLFNSSFQDIIENFINVITRTADVDNVEFDGIPLTDRGIEFKPVGVNGQFSFARVPVDAGAHTIISDGCGVIATAYGYGEIESYAYSGGASFSTINANPIPEGGCLNDTVFFDTGLSPNRYNFDWDLGDGITSDKGAFTHFFPELGEYPIRLIVEDECLGTTDTLFRDLEITLRQAVAADPDQILCEGEAFELGATDLAGATYEWTGPNAFTSEEQFPSIVRSSLNMDGQYSVIGIVSGCATFPANLNVDILENPTPYLGEDDIICVKNLAVDLTPGQFEAYAWQDNSTNDSFSVPTGGGTYWVEVTDEQGCVGMDSITLIQQCPTVFFIPDAFSPNGDGLNDFFQVFAQDISEMELKIFNRWGSLVYQSTNLEETWDGTYNGQLMEVGVYMYELIYKGFRIDGSTFMDNEYGTVTIVR